MGSLEVGRTDLGGGFGGFATGVERVVAAASAAAAAALLESGGDGMDVLVDGLGSVTLLPKVCFSFQRSGMWIYRVVSGKC